MIRQSEYAAMTNAPKNKLSPHRQALYEAAEAQRKLCRDWLLCIMSASSQRTRTKDDLRADAIDRFGVSKKAFDAAWTWAIEESGNRHWYEPLPRSRRSRADKFAGQAKVKL